jgi:predicted amidohydrolase YtcJ
MKRADILLKNAVIVTMDQGRRIIDQGVVAVKGRYIAAVGGEELQKEFYVIICSNSRGKGD